MKLLRRSIPRRALLWLALPCVALPALAWAPRLTVFFQATFDTSGSPGGGLMADVGQFQPPVVPAQFSVVAVPSGGGQLKIEDGGSASAAVLDAEFKKLFKGQELDLCWTVQPFQSDAGLVVSVQDAGDSGLIDCGYDDDGSVDVGGVDTGYEYEPGQTYKVHMALKDNLAGAGSWTLDIECSSYPAFHATGSFDPGIGFTAHALRFTRPANDHGGKFLVDDIRVTSTSNGANY